MSCLRGERVFAQWDPTQHKCLEKRVYGIRACLGDVNREHTRSAEKMTNKLPCLRAYTVVRKSDKLASKGGKASRCACALGDPTQNYIT